MTATDPRAPAPAATIAPAEKPAREMTTLEIQNEQNDLGRRWADLQKQLEESGGHSGSPGEWMVERMDELDTEWKRRQDRAAQGGAEEEAVRRYPSTIKTYADVAEHERAAYVAGHTGGAAWQREQAAPAPDWKRVKAVVLEDGRFVDMDAPAPRAQTAEVLAVLEPLRRWLVNRHENPEQPSVSPAYHVRKIDALAARLRSPAPSEDGCCEQYLLDEVYCTTCPRAAPLQEPAPRAQTAEGEAMERATRAMHEVDERYDREHCAKEHERYHPISFDELTDWEKAKLRDQVSAALSALPQSDFAAQDAENIRGRWEPTDSHARANGLTDAMRNAYYDLIPISPGTETWAMAGLPTPDKVWEAMTAAAPDPDGVRVSRQWLNRIAQMLVEERYVRVAGEIDAILGRASS